MSSAGTGWLAGRSVVVTGAGRGLGRAYARAAAHEGALVVVNDVDGEPATEVVAEIVRSGGQAVAAIGSVSDASGASMIIDTCIDVYGSIDALVNNAAVLVHRPAAETTHDDIVRSVAVNVSGVLHCGLAAIGPMCRDGGGVIVNITSGAHLGMSGFAVYGATKGAVASITYGWALELAAHNVRVMGFSPLAGTRMADDPSALPDPDVIAPAMTFLLSDRSKGLDGQVLRFDGTSVSFLSRPAFAGPFATGGHWTPSDVADAVHHLRDGATTSGLVTPGEEAAR